MEKTKIPIITLAIFSISLLIMLAFITNPQNMAMAISASNFVLASSNNVVFYQESIDTYVILQKNTVASASTVLCFLSANSVNPTADQVCYTIYPQKDGCDLNTLNGISNQCSATVGSTDCDISFADALPCSDKTGLTGFFKALWCGATYCFINFDYETGSWSSQIIRVWSLGANSATTGDISGYRNITNTWVLSPAMWGYDECNPAPPNCGLGGISLFWSYSVNTATAPTIVLDGGTALIGTVNSASTALCPIATCASTQDQTFIDGCRHCHSIQGQTRILISQGHTNGGTRTYVLYNEQLTEQTSITVNGVSAGCVTVGGQGANTGLNHYMGRTMNRFVFNTDTGFVFLNATSGAFSGANCYVDASFPFIDYVRDIEIDEENNSYYVWHGSTQTLASVSKMNLTSITGTIDFAPDDITISHTISGFVDGGQPFHSMGFANNTQTLLTATDSGLARLYYLDGFEQEEEEGGNEGAPNGVCLNVDANGDGRVNVLDCLRQDSAIGSLTATMNVTTIVTQLGQGVGFLDPDNDDPKTNGAGLLLMLMTGVFFAGTLASVISTLNKKGWVNMSVKEIDPIFWLFLVVGVVGVAFYLQWIPDLIFYGMIAGIAGLVALGVLKFGWGR